MQDCDFDFARSLISGYGRMKTKARADLEISALVDKEHSLKSYLDRVNSPKIQGFIEAYFFTLRLHLHLNLPLPI